MHGRCYYCNKELTERTIKRHMKSCKEMRKFIRDEISDKESRTRNQFIISIKDKYDKNTYCVYISISSVLQLLHLDRFIRDVWVNCCDHLSCFIINKVIYNDNSNEMYEMSVRLNDILFCGMKFQYEYDFGTSTYLELEVIDELKVSEKHSMIEIIARNDEIEHKCRKCGEHAEYINYNESEFLCKKCSEYISKSSLENLNIEYIGDTYFNSPRDGICSYRGNRDAEKKYMPGNNHKYKIDTHKTHVNDDKYNLSGYIDDDSFPTNYRETDLLEGFLKSLMNNSMHDLENIDVNEKLKEISCNHLIKSMDNYIKSTEKLFSKGKYSFDLEELINSLSKDKIDIILSNNYIELKGNLKKSEFAHKFIYEYEKIMNERVLDFETDKIDFLKRCLKKEGIIKYIEEDFDKCLFFLNRGILFPAVIDGDYVFIMPEIMQNLVMNFDKIEIRRNAKKNQKIISLFRGMIRAYGIIDFIDAYNILKKYEDNIDKERLERILGEGSIYDPNYYSVDWLSNGNVIYINNDIEDYEGLLKKMDKDCSFHEFCEKKLLEMADHDYFEKCDFGKKFLNEFSNVTYIDYDSCVEGMNIMIIDIQYRDIQDVVKDIMEGLYPYDKSALTNTINRFLEDIPLWRMKGASLKEIKKNSIHTVMNKKKLHIGRNELCPCGSGKKYKVCCGKNDNVIRMY
ncbi:SEC-C metal-binding domain-containing protein [uncultured Clostridium sp.]|uniref:SEC-C metal-binding domain-containing protein n=1 Tax=uncultured Clostridium sp. TaxID=59620 RepID=UPI0025D76C97|nr:SEC-C metal-binding domain-containing protein [uncultured Clostridium sp.]